MVEEWKQYASLIQALEEGPYALVAGGTDLMVRGINPGVTPIFLSAFDGLDRITYEEETSLLTVGARVTYDELEAHPKVPKVLKTVIRTIGAPAIRNQATLIGNLCNASPSGDTLPLLTILDATLIAVSKEGVREIPIADWMVGPGKTALRDKEVVISVHIPCSGVHRRWFMTEKVGSRKADAIAKVTMAGSFEMDGNRIVSCRLAFGAIAPKIVRVPEMEERLVHATVPLEQEVIDGLVQDYSAYFNPIDDRRSTAIYRMEVAKNLCREFFSKEPVSGFLVRGHFVHTPSAMELETLYNQVLYVENGYIKHRYASLEEARLAYPDVEWIDYKDRVIIPSFVDLHVHGSQYDQIGLGMDLQLIDWLNTYTFHLESKFEDLTYARGVYERFTDELIKVGSLRSCIFATIHKEASLLLCELLDKKGLAAYVGKVNMDRNSSESLKENTEESLKETEAFIQEAQTYAYVKPMLTPRFSPTCTPELLEGLGELAKAYDVPVQSHLSESTEEVTWVQELFPGYKHYSDTYDRHGLFGQKKTLMAHGIYLTKEERLLLQDVDVTLVHCPDSNMNIKSGVMPVHRYMNEGIQLGLGSDVGGGSKMMMTSAIVSAIQNSKLLALAQGGHPITFSEAFYMATRGGGKFFGNCGSFECGMSFDALVIDMSDETATSLSPEETVMRFCYRDAFWCITQRYLNGHKIIKHHDGDMKG